MLAVAAFFPTDHIFSVCIPWLATFMCTPLTVWWRGRNIGNYTLRDVDMDGYCKSTHFSEPPTLLHAFPRALAAFTHAHLAMDSADIAVHVELPACAWYAVVSILSRMQQDHIGHLVAKCDRSDDVVPAALVVALQRDYVAFNGIHGMPFDMATTHAAIVLGVVATVRVRRRARYLFCAETGLSGKTSFVRK